MKKTNLNFSEDLSDKQSEDVEIYILSFIEVKEFCEEQTRKFFKRGSDTSSLFLIDYIEKEISWFDYKYASAILDEIDGIVEFLAEDVDFSEYGETESETDETTTNESQIDWNKLNGNEEDEF